MLRCQAALLAAKKHPNRMPLFQVVYGQSLILTRCVVSNGSKTKEKLSGKLYVF